MIYGINLPNAYHKALISMKFADIVPCPAWNTRCLEIPMQLCIINPTSEPMISRFFPGGARDLEQYRQEMLDGIMDFRIGDGWDYTYHDRMTALRFTEWSVEGDIILHTTNQIKFVLEELKRDPYSRRAVISVRSNFDIFSDDPACLQSIQFMIRNGKLNMYVLFRSEDLFKAAFMNMFALICLQERIAAELGVEVGHYYHTVNSMHVYERDWEALNGAVKRIAESPREEVTYPYKGFYGELMAAERPAIAKMVEGLKNAE